GPGVGLTAAPPAARSNSGGAPSTIVLTPTAMGNSAAPESLTPSPPSAPRPPTLCPGDQSKIVVCGRLRLASMDQVLSLIVSLPVISAALEVGKTRKIADSKKAEFDEEAAAANTTRSDNAANAAELQAKADAAKKESDVAESAAAFAKEKLYGPNHVDGLEPQGGVAKQYKYSEKEIGYLRRLLNRAGDSRFGGSESCEENAAAAAKVGEQKAAIVALLQWLLDAMTGVGEWGEDRKKEVKSALKDEYSKLSPLTIRKQILMLNSYIGNVQVQLEWTEGTGESAKKKTKTVMADRDGNFKFEVAPASTDTEVTFILSTDGDNYQTQEEIKSVAKGTCVKVNLRIEDRPVSLLVRSVIGGQQSAAAATE